MKSCKSSEQPQGLSSNLGIYRKLLLLFVVDTVGKWYQGFDEGADRFMARWHR